MKLLEQRGTTDRNYTTLAEAQRNWDIEYVFEFFNRIYSFMAFIFNLCQSIDLAIASHNYSKINIREDIKTKKTFQFGHCPSVGGGGVYPCPNFLDTFF